jgi:hypothetical protein
VIPAGKGKTEAAIMERGKDKEMDSRVGNLERSVAVLQTTQDGMKVTLDKVASGLELLLAQQSEIRAQKPFSLRESLSTILTTLMIFSIFITALTYKIDTQVITRLEPAQKVAEMLTEKGDYFLLKERVSHLEKAIAWTPQIVPIGVAQR